MHRDLKLGLALAVLLIGSTTAFFFRNDDPDAGLPKLKDPARLDGIIAERATAPYLGESEPANAGSEAASPWTKPAFLGSPSAAVRRTSVTPDPIQIVLEEDAELLGPVLPATARAQEPARDADGNRVHVVASGDTLSGLAAKYLGSTARFGEIFDLNRDRLKDPHDLRIGMTLRIPSREAAAGLTQNKIDRAIEQGSDADADATAAAAALDAASQTHLGKAIPAGPASPISAPSAERLFVPARKTPFIPGRYRGPRPPSANAADVGTNNDADQA